MPNIRAQRIDITALASDAIVNAANPQLLGGGGVDGAIHRAAGPELLAACRALPELRRGVRCETGEARITPGFRLRARHVIHTVGPIWQGGKADEDRLLSNCYRNSVALASAHGLTSLAFPAISCGVYGYPHERACRVAVAALRAYPWQDASVQDVVLTAFDAAMLKLWAAALALPN